MRNIPLSRRALITGGAGFIGTNLAHRLVRDGYHVTVFDNLSRDGVERNADWLVTTHGDVIHLEIADVRDADRLKVAVQSVSQVFHLAAQVAVTSSLLDPRHDYEVNVGGTINVLEALRSMKKPASLVFTSTNKVYGELVDFHLNKLPTRYAPANRELGVGVNEDTRLAFHSPYGCSKGAADQYVLDYARYFNIPATVFRMSCIYGPHQMGTEDQGWVAHFLRQSLDRQTIKICGDGLQVRDILYIDDLVDAFVLAQKKIVDLSGRPFNIGGGCGNTTSLVELLSLIEKLDGRRPVVAMDEWRQGDQRFYVSDIRRFQSLTGWSPKVTAQEGVRNLYRWLSEEYAEPPVTQLGGQRAVLAG